jgi:hypothetical protein
VLITTGTFYETVDRIAAVFGEVILAPVRRLSNRVLKYYLFRQYNSTAAIPIEVQVCHALEQQKLISVSYPMREYQVWTDICQILFCQAFLYKDDRNLWKFDLWEIRNPSAIDICWKNLSTYKVQHFLNKQWRFLEELGPPDIAVRRRKYLLRRLWSNYIRTFKRGGSDQNKYYSHYDNELELLSPENLIIKESWSKISPSDLNSIVQHLNSTVQKMSSDSDFNTTIQERTFDGDFIARFLRYSDDGRSLFYRSYNVKNKEPFIIRAEATLKEGTDFDFQFLWHLWHFKEPLTYYLALLQCIDESSLIKLMEDLLSDFDRPLKYYQENIKNVDLNPWRWGMPDIVAYDNENNFHILLECKRPNGRLSKRQIRWLSRNSERYKLNVGLVVVSENQVGKL